MLGINILIPDDDESGDDDESFDEDGDYLVWAENWDTWCVFRDCGTQWIVLAGMSGFYYQGIDYMKLATVMDFKTVPDDKRAAMFDDIRLMEGVAKQVLNEKIADAIEQR